MSDAEISVVTIKDLWQAQQTQSDRLAEGLNAVKMALERLSGHMDALDTLATSRGEALSDHEDRLRSLERWRYALPVSALSAVGAAIAAILQTVHH